MEIREIAAFESVVETGSLSKAAEKLGASQPSISKHIALLEESIGTRLFDRTASGMVLNEAGKSARHPMQKLLSFVSKWEQELDGQSLQSGTRELKLAVSEFVLTMKSFRSWFQSFVRLAEDHWAGKVVIEERPTDADLRAEIEQGGIDLAIAPRWELGACSGNLLVMPAFVSKVCAYAPSGKFADGQVNQLPTIGIARRCSPGFETFLDAFLPDRRDVRILYDSVSSALMAVSLGQGGFLGGDHVLNIENTLIRMTPIRGGAPLEVDAVLRKDNNQLQELLLKLGKTKNEKQI